MIWHRLRGHAIRYHQMVSLSHPDGWFCSCGKRWIP
jgi:hypothetical protein